MLKSRNKLKVIGVVKVFYLACLLSVILTGLTPDPAAAHCLHSSCDPTQSPGCNFHKYVSHECDGDCVDEFRTFEGVCPSTTGFFKVLDTKGEEIPTCRSCELPYEEAEQKIKEANRPSPLVNDCPDTTETFNMKMYRQKSDCENANRGDCTEINQCGFKHQTNEPQKYVYDHFKIISKNQDVGYGCLPCEYSD